MSTTTLSQATASPDAPSTDALRADAPPASRAPHIDPTLRRTATQAANPALGGSLAEDADQPLVFKYSESKATGVWLNKTRMLGFSRLGGTLSKGLSGLLDGSAWRVASSVTGVLANLSYFIWGNSNQGRKREITLAHGDWQNDNGQMTQISKGELPKDALQQLESIFEAAELPKDSVSITYDSAKNQSKISISENSFPKLQSHMQHILTARQSAVEILHDDLRVMHQTTKNRELIQAIRLDGVSENSVNMLKHVVETEWKIPVSIVHTADGRKMTIPDAYRDRFLDERTHSPRNLKESIRINPIQEQPAGFWEALVHPEKYPVQFGTNLGGLVSNVFGIVAAAKGDRKSHDKPLVYEMLSNVISQMAYIIEAQREISPPVKGDNVIQNNAKLSAVDRLLEHVSENPMRASTPFKLASLYYRGLDAYSTNSNSKKSVVFFDAMTSLISFHITKRDYGK